MKKYDRRFKTAAVIFGVSVAAAVLMFVLSKGRTAENENDEVFSDNRISRAAVTEDTKLIPSPPLKMTETGPFVVTANSDDILSESLLGLETTPFDREEGTRYLPEEEEGEERMTVAETAPPAIITSRDRSEYNGVSVYIEMKNILQNPELPVGCEITALTILLNYWGFDAEKCDMARNYLPVSTGRHKYEDGKTYKDSFFDFFIGDPFSRGYGCFAHAIEKAANSYIGSHGGGFTVKNISGCSPDTLYSYVKQDIPVLVWATDGMIEPEYYETWYDIDTGEQLDWYLNEHCAVLAGFDIDKDTVTFNDPMKGIKDYNIDRFETRFKQMHSQALVIIPDSPAEYTEEQTEAQTEAPTETEPVTTTAMEATETEPETTAATAAETEAEITETATSPEEVQEEETSPEDDDELSMEIEIDDE